MSQDLRTYFGVRLTALQEFGLFGIFLSIPLFRLGNFVLGSPSLTPAKLFVAFTILAWLANLLLSRDLASVARMIGEEANIFLLIYFGFTLVSLVNARHLEDPAIGELLQRVKLLTLYLLMIGIVKDRKVLKIAVVLLLISSVLTTCVGLYELVTGDAFFSTSPRLGVTAGKTGQGLEQTLVGGALRVQGLYSQAGYHAYAVLLFFCLALPWLIHAKSAWTRALVAGLLLGYVANIIGTGTRTAWVGLACVLPAFLVVLRHRHKYAIFAGAVLALLLVFLGLSLIPHVPTFQRLLFGGNDIGISFRSATWRQAVEMVRQHPWLGVGTGNYIGEYRKYLYVAPGLSSYLLGWLHNSFLQVWAENGTFAFLVFCAFFVSIGLGLFLTYMRAEDRELQALALGLFISHVALIVLMIGMPVMNQELGWMTLGLSVALFCIAREERRAAPQPASAAG